MFLKSFKSSLRSLVKNKVFSSIGIVGFAAGFSVCLIIGMYLFNELTVDGFHKNKDRIYRVVNAKDRHSGLDYNLKEKLENNYPGIEKVCPVEINQAQNQVSTGQNTVFVDGLISTTNNFFEVFSIHPIRNISDKPFMDENSAVITETTAKLLFGEEDPLGKSIEVLQENKRNPEESVISAIIPDFPPNSSIQGQILRNADNKNFRMHNTAIGNNGKFRIFTITDQYLMLEKNQNYSDIEQRLSATIENYEMNVDSVFLQPLKSIYFETATLDNNRHGNIRFVRILSIIGFMILLLSVVNYINYIISSQFKKHKEIGIKKTIGAKVSHLLSYYTTDILLWIIISFLISISIVVVTLPWFNSLFQVDLQLKELMDVRFIAVGLIVILFIVLASLFPYLVMLSKFRILNFLTGNLGKAGKSRVGSILTVFQLTISILLISGLLIVQRQINYVKFQDLGFNDNELLYVNLPPFNEKSHESIKNECLKNPAISKATLSSGTPGGNFSRMLLPDGIIYIANADEQFIPTIEIELKEGRNFLPSDSSNNAIIVNEALIASMNIDSIDLSMFGIGEIIGVVKNFNFESLHQNVQPLIITYGTGRSMSLRLSTENLPAVMDYINNVWKDFYPDEPMQYKFYDTWFDSMYRQEEQISHAGMIFSIIAIIITCLGLLGKIIQVSLTRTKEIGIRKVNGAKVSEILSLLNKDFIKWVAIAFVIATPIAYFAMNKWLQNFAYKTNLNWWIFVLAGLLAMGIALLSVSFQSWKAATRNPVEALRYE